MGRDDERDALAHILASESSSATLILGGPGIGKTELTKAIAHHPDVAARFGGHRYFVELENEHSARDMQAAIIRALGCDPQYGFQAALSTLQGKQSLLILDNLETPWLSHDQRHATEQVLADLAAIPGVAILASFRGRDAVGGLRWVEHPLTELPRTDAIQLFALIAGQWALADPDLGNFTYTLGGIPLAIEFVARRAYGRSSLAALWKEWERIGVKLAEHPDFDAGRLTSVPHSIELSLQSERITPPALRLFYILGNLPDGLAHEDRDALIGEAAFDAEERLYRAGLVIERAGRIVLLPPVRDHALRRTQSSCEDDTTWIKHFIGLVRRLGETIGTMRGDGALPRLSSEYDNIEAAFRAAIDYDLYDEAMAALRGFANYAHLAGASTTIFSDYAPLCHARGDILGEAQCLSGMGDQHLGGWDLKSAREAFERALPLYEEVGDMAGEAYCRRSLGYTFSDDPAKRDAAFEHSLALSRQIEDALGEAHCILEFAVFATFRSDDDAAQGHFSEALSLYRQADYALGQANCLDGLGEIALRRSDPEAARAVFKEALRLFEIVGNRGVVGSYAERLCEL